MSTVIELAGFACFVVAGWLVTPALGFAIAGVALVLIGNVLDGQPIPGMDQARQLSAALAQRFRLRLAALMQQPKETQ